MIQELRNGEDLATRGPGRTILQTVEFKFEVLTTGTACSAAERERAMGLEVGRAEASSRGLREPGGRGGSAQGIVVHEIESWFYPKGNVKPGEYHD